MASENYAKVFSGFTETEGAEVFISCGFVPKFCFILAGGFGTDLLWSDTMPPGVAMKRDFLGALVLTTLGPVPKQVNNVWGLAISDPEYISLGGQINYTIMG